MKTHEPNRGYVKQSNPHIESPVIDVVSQSRFQLVCDFIGKDEPYKPNLLYIPNEDAKKLLISKPDLLMIASYENLQYWYLMWRIFYKSLKFDPFSQRLKLISPLVRSSNDRFDIKKWETGIVLTHI